MSKENTELLWCRSCEDITELFDDSTPDYPLCARCGEEMVDYGSLGKSEKRDYRLMKWMKDVQEAGMWGPSPGGAAGDLGCHRSMIDKLVDRGILEKSVYDKDGQFIVFISNRSIEKAKANKEKTGKWTDSGED